MKNYISKATLALLVALSATGFSDFLDEKLKSDWLRTTHIQVPMVSK